MSLLLLGVGDAGSGGGDTPTTGLYADDGASFLYADDGASYLTQG